MAILDLIQLSCLFSLTFIFSKSSVTLLPLGEYRYNEIIRCLVTVVVSSVVVVTEERKVSESLGCQQRKLIANNRKHG